MKKKWLAVTLSLSLLVPTLAACTKSKGQDAEGERVLRIAAANYGDDNEYFRQQFTELFEFANPNIKIEFIPTRDTRYMYGASRDENEKPEDPLEKLKEVMQGANPPDIVMFDIDEMPDLLDNNLLTPLDPLIAKDKFDTSDIVPAVMDGLKGASTDGKLYALAPTFSSSALIYNKKMFDDAGVAYPTDNMTWDQVFDLARRVSKGDGDDRVYGFNFYPYSGNDLFNSIHAYTAPLQLNMFDEKGEKMTVDTDQWEKVWTTLIQLQKDNVIPGGNEMNERMMRKDREGNPFSHNDFMSGRIAMTIMYYGGLSEIDNANKNAEHIKGYNKIDYDVVTIPSHSEAPGIVPEVGLNVVMGINAKAQNVDDAWKYLKFVNGEEWAKLKSHSNYQLVSRKKYIKPREGSSLHIEAFYNIKPVANQNEFYRLYREKPNIHMVQQVGRQEMQAVIEGQKSVREALKSWQATGDAMLLQLKQDPKADLDQFMQQSRGVQAAGKGG